MISVIVPIYKVEAYLARCVDSILQQSYRDFELILVDDGSPDNCGAMCDSYARQDSRVKVLHKRNGGLSDARNAALDIATGEYISFIDSDDWISPRYLEVLYGLITDRNVKISACNFQKVSGEEDVASATNAARVIHEYQPAQAFEHFFGEMHAQIVVAWGKLYHRDLLQSIRYPLGKYHEDEFVTWRLIHAAGKIAFTSEALYYYFQRPGSIVGAGFNIRKRLDALEAYEERADFLQSLGMERLAARTYHHVFVKSFNIESMVRDLGDDARLSEHKRRVRGLKEKLRRSKQSSSFRLFYEMFYLAPGAFRVGYRLLRRTS